MDSKDANATSLSGLSSLSSDNSIETNGLKSAADVNVSPARISGGSRSGSDDEDEGFASVEEEAFETALEENPISAEEIEAEDNGESFLEPAEFPMPEVESANSSDVMDEAEKVVLEGDVGLVGHGLGPTAAEDNPKLDENLDTDEVVKGPVLDGSEGDKVDESKEAVIDESMESLNDKASINASKAVSTDEISVGINEQGDTEVTEFNDVKPTKEGDSVVEATQVDMPVKGVAVVPDLEDDEDDDDDVVLVGGPDDSSNIVESPGAEFVDADAVNLPAEGDSVVDAIDVDLPVPEVAGVAVVTKMEEDENRVDVFGSSEKRDLVLEEVVDKEVIAVTDGKFAPLDVEASVGDDEEMNEKIPEAEIQKGVDYEAEENGSVVKTAVDDAEVSSAPLDIEASVGDNEGMNEKNPEAEIQKGVDYEAKENGSVVKTAVDDAEVSSVLGLESNGTQAEDFIGKSMTINPADEAAVSASVEDNGLENGSADTFVLEESAEKDDADEKSYMDGSPSDEDTEDMIFGSSEAAKQFIEDLERRSGGGEGSHSGGESSQDRSQMIDGQIVTDSDEEDEEEDGKELFDSAALAALLKAAGAADGSGGGNITFSSQDGSRLFTVERPAGLGSSLESVRQAPRPARSTLFNSSSLVSANGTDANLSAEETKKLEKIQSIRVKLLRLVHRLGLSPDDSVAAQVLYRLALIAGRQTGQSFSLDAAKTKAMELENGNDDLDFSVNILVIGKSGVGKSATINSIFGEEKSSINAFQPATSAVKEINGIVDGVKIRVFDTPGLKSSALDQGFNRSILSSAKRLTKKNPLDIVLYVDRLDAQTRDLNDLPLLKTITSSLGSSIWRSTIVTLTHAASAPPEGPSGTPLNYEVFVTQRSHVVQQGIGQAVGDMRMMSPSLMNPVSLVENHPSCRKNREGQKVLPNGRTWRPQLLMLCYSMKILSEANSLSKAQDPYDHRKLFGFRVRSPPLPYMLSSMLQSRAYPKLSSEEGGDSDVDLSDLSDSDQEDDEEYDQLPPFKPLRKSQISKLSNEQKKAYFDEYDYRVKLLQKKQWKEELKRMREMKKGNTNDYDPAAEEGEDGSPAPVAVPLPDMALPPSFDSDNPAYKYRFLEPTSQFLARPVLDTHGWDHDCGYDGVNVEQTLAVAGRFPAAISVQITKDKKDFNINLDSSVSTKHGEKGSSMAGFDVQPIGKQLAYVVRGETKFKNTKKNKTAAGVSVTFLGENVVAGFKVEDQITFGKQYSMVGSAGTVRFQKDSAYGANVELQRRELGYPVGQVQSSFGLSLVKWRGDLALGFNGLAQFSAGRNSKVAVRAGINNKMSGQITVKTSSSEHLSLALAAVLPSVLAAYRKLCPDVGDKYSPY